MHKIEGLSLRCRPLLYLFCSLQEDGRQESTEQELININLTTDITSQLFVFPFMFVLCIF